ncbi:MAG: hypothetical protein QNK37_29270, partial [Acidobacteriota bacterium]|nr:hypothetical protein [Acidobacteriota bacterium]
LEDPAKTFDPDQAPPHLRGRAATDGKLWIDKLAAAMGGERIDKLNTYTETYEEPTERRGKQYQHHVLNRIDFPDGFHHEDDWDDSRFHRTVKGDSGRFSGREGEWDMVPVQVRAMKREFLTQPLLLLRARTENGFLAATAGEETIEGKPAVKVIVAYRNFNQTLLIDKATHQLLAQRFRGRGQGALFAPMEKRYREYREIDGLMLPTQVETRQDDEVLRTENWRVSVR